MRVLASIFCVLLAAGTAAGQRHKLTINTETPEGQLLQQIGTEENEPKKIVLLEDFASKYPKHEGAAQVYELMVTLYGKAGQFDKALDAGDKLLALDPEDVVGAHECLKAAEAKKDADAIVKWSQATSDAAKKVAAKPKPANEDEDDWKQRVDFAKQVDLYTEYSLFAAALQQADPKKKILLAEALETRNPNSQYVPQIAEQQFQAYMQPGGDTAKGLAFAEKQVNQGRGTVEMMLAAASGYMSNKQPDKVAELTTKAIAAAEAKAKPEGVDDAAWQTWKTQVTGRAHWMAGLSYAGQNKWAQADQELRQALAGVKTERNMLAEALFYLGVANYRLAEAGQTQRAADAYKFSQECAAIPGRFQAPAATNVKAIRSQYHMK